MCVGSFVPSSQMDQPSTHQSSQRYGITRPKSERRMSMYQRRPRPSSISRPTTGAITCRMLHPQSSKLRLLLHLPPKPYRQQTRLWSFQTYPPPLAAPTQLSFAFAYSLSSPPSRSSYPIPSPRSEASTTSTLKTSVLSRFPPSSSSSHRPACNISTKPPHLQSPKSSYNLSSLLLHLRPSATI